MASAYDEQNPDDLWKAVGISENSAVYEFTKAFTRTAVIKYENLGKKKGRGRKFGKIGGELIKLGAFPGPSRSSPHSKAIRQITALGLQSVADYVDTLMQAKTKISIISIINAKSSKSFDETFLLCFIVFALYTYDKYKASLEYINLEAPGEKTARENKVQAIQMLAEYAGALCFSALLKCERKKEVEFLKKLGKKNLKKDLKSQWTAATLVNLYYWAQEKDDTAQKLKKVITPYEFFVERKLHVFDEGDLDSACSAVNFCKDSKENSWAEFWKIKKSEYLIPKKNGLIPVKSHLKEDSETLGFSWAPINLDANIEKYARVLYDFIVRDESFSRDVTGTNLVKDLHAKVDEQNSKLNELLEKLEEEKCITETNESLQFQIQKPIRTFTGRLSCLADLHKKLKECTADKKRSEGSLTQAPLIVLAGPAGIGKTEAVRMYINKYGHGYNHIVWINAGNQFSAQAQFRVKLATELRVKTEFRGKPNPLETIVKEIYTKMCQNVNGEVRSVLIIFDDADSFNDDSERLIKGIQAYLPPLTCKNAFLETAILVTSRNKNWDLLQNTIILLDPWKENDSISFCLKQLNLLETAQNKKDAAELANSFSFNPFALQAAMAVILKRQTNSADTKYSITDFITNYKNCGRRTVFNTQPIEYSGTDPKKPTMIDLWVVTFQKILKLKNGYLAIKIICFSAYISLPCLTSKLLASLLSKVEQNNLEQALDLLQNYFVIEQSNNELAIQPIIRDIAKDIINSEENYCNFLLQKTFVNHAALLFELSTGLVQYLETRLKQNEISSKECDNIVDNILAVISLWTELSLSTKEYEKVIHSVEMTCSISKSYALRMDYNKIIDIYGTLLKGAEIRHGPKHTLSITLKKKTGDVLMNQRRYTDAKDVYVQVYTSQKTLLGRKHPDTLATQICIADAIKCLGNYAGALKTFFAVLIKQRELQDPSGDPVALKLKFKVAELLYEHGEYTDAVKLFERVHKDSERILGQDAANIFQLQIQTWIARVFVKQEKYDKAIELYTDLMKTHENVRGPHHRDTLLIKSDYAIALSYQGDHGTALNMLQGIFEYQNGTLGYSMLELAETENNLAHVKIRLDDTKSAIKIYAHVRQVQLAHLGPGHPLTLSTQQAWAYALYREKKFSECTLHFIDVLSGQRKALGEYHPDTIWTLQHLIQVSLEQEDFKMAAAFASELFELKKRKKSLVADHPHLVRYQQLLDLSIRKLPKTEQGYSKLKKPPPPPPASLHLPAWIYVEGGSVSKNIASNCCLSGLGLRRADGSRYWCWKLKMWTRVIAAVQIMRCSAVLILMVFNLFSNRPTTIFEYDLRSWSKYLAEVLDLLIWKLDPAWTAAVNCIYIVAGCFLHAGVHFENQVYILIWMCVEIFTIGVSLMYHFGFVYLISAGRGIRVEVEELFVSGFIKTPQHVICLFVVFYYHQELREQLIRAGEEFNSVQFDYVNFA